MQVIQIDPNNKDEMEFWESNNENVAQMARSSPTDNVVVGHVCKNFVCSAPVADPDALRALLTKGKVTAPSG